MGRPKGSKNKKPRTIATTGGVDVTSRPDTSPPQDAVEAPAQVAPGSPQEGGAEAALAVGATVTHPDGRTGEVTAVEPRGDAHAVCVRWTGDDDDTQYTPSDWQEMGATVEGAREQTAQTEPAPTPADSDESRAPETQYGDDDEPQPPVGIGGRLAEIGHEWADTDQQLVAKESEKSTVVKQYTKEIDILESRCRQLAAEYREAEWPVTYDYRKGIKHVWNGRTGRLARTEKLGSYQVPLDLDHPGKPPVEVTVTPAAPTEPVAEVLEQPVTEGEPDALEPTPFDEPGESETTEAVEA